MNGLRITFLQEAVLGDDIKIIYNNTVNNPNLIAFAEEKFQFTTRNQSGEIQVYDPSSADPSPYLSPAGKYTANKYVTFFSLDFNWNNLFEINQNNNIIELLIPEGWEFDSVESSENSNPNLYTWEIFEANTGFQIESVVPNSSNGNECSKWELDFVLSQNAREIRINGITVEENLNDVNYSAVDLIRGASYLFRFENQSGVRINYPENLFGIGVNELLSINVDIIITTSPTGATVSFMYNDIAPNSWIDLQVEWSTDGINYSSDLILTGQITGEYSIFARDQFGCVIEINYEITESGIREKHHFISQANSINYVLQEEIDNCKKFKNQENSFNKNSLNDINFCDNILFNTCDKIKSQLHTNYSNVEITLRKENGDLVLIPPVQQTNNLNRFQSFDAFIYSYQDNLSGIYFTNGNIYDENGLDIGDHSLNGNVPLMAKTGNSIQINGIGSFIIVDVLYDENIQKNVIIIQNNFLSLPQQVIVSSTFDLLHFEVIEWDIDFNSYGNGLYDVVVKLTDDKYDDVYYISENIEILESHYKTLAIIYYNNENNNKDIFYKYGIKNFIRIPYLDIELDVNDELENNPGDLINQLTYSSINKKDRIMFDALPENIRFKLILACGCENLFIQGLGYAKDNNSLLEHIENTNAAYLTQEFIRTNVNYNNNDQSQINLDNAFIFEVTPFINEGSKFIKKNA